MCRLFIGLKVVRKKDGEGLWDAIKGDVVRRNSPALYSSISHLTHLALKPTTANQCLFTAMKLESTPSDSLPKTMRLSIVDGPCAGASGQRCKSTWNRHQWLCSSRRRINHACVIVGALLGHFLMQREASGLVGMRPKGG